MLYRAEAKRSHHGRKTRWRGKWRKDIAQAIAQAERWQTSNPSAEISIVCSNGMRATLDEDIEAARRPPDTA